MPDAAAPPAAVLVAPLRGTLDRAATVGRRKTGQLCWPAGKLRWADVRPDAGELADAIVALLRTRGVRAYLSDEARGLAGIRTTILLRPDVTALTLDACVPQTGMFRLAGGRRTLKMAGTATITWHVTRIDATGDERREDLTHEVPLASDPRSNDVAAIVGAAIARDAATVPLLP